MSTEMADQIERINGKDLFVSRKLDAWHGLGTITDGDIAVGDFLELAGLDNWNVTKVPLRVAIPGPRGGVASIVERPGRYMTVRMKDAKILGESVGPQYVPFQAEEILDLAAFLVGDSGRLQPETAGSLKEGTWVFLTFRIDEAWNLKADPHVPYLALISSHDGTLSLTGLATATRVVCANTANLALQSGDHGRYRIPHRTTIEDQRDAMRAVFEQSLGYIDDLQDEADRLMHRPLTTRQFDLFLDGMFPVADTMSERGVTNARKNRHSIRSIYEASDEVGDFQGTAWGALQAVNVHELWIREIRQIGEHRPEDIVRRERQVEALLSNDGNELTEKARIVLAAV